MWMLLLALGCSVKPPEMVPVAAGPATVSIVRAEDPKRSGDAHNGLITGVAGPVTQSLSWTPDTGDLHVAAEHEVDLMRRAAEGLGNSLQVAQPPHDAKVAGQPALTWEASTLRTHFLGTAFRCGDTTVVVTTFGAGESVVAATHAASVDGAACEP